AAFFGVAFGAEALPVALRAAGFFAAGFFFAATFLAAAFFAAVFFAVVFFAVFPVFAAVRFTVRLVAISTPRSLGMRAGIASASFTPGERPRRPLVVIQRPKHAVC